MNYKLHDDKHIRTHKNHNKFIIILLSISFNIFMNLLRFQAADALHRQFVGQIA